MRVQGQDKDVTSQRLPEAKGLAVVRWIARAEAKGDRERFNEYVSVNTAIRPVLINLYRTLPSS